MRFRRMARRRNITGRQSVLFTIADMLWHMKPATVRRLLRQRVADDAFWEQAEKLVEHRKAAELLAEELSR